MKNIEEDIDIPLTAAQRRDISDMIANLVDLQARGTLKIYCLYPGQSADEAFYSVSQKIANLVDEDEMIEAEIREAR